MGSSLVMIMTVTRPRKYLTSPKQVFYRVFLLFPCCARAHTHSRPLSPFLAFSRDAVTFLFRRLHKFNCHVSNDTMSLTTTTTTLMMICLVACLVFCVWCTPTEIEVNIIGVISIIYSKLKHSYTQCRKYVHGARVPCASVHVVNVLSSWNVQNHFSFEATETAHTPVDSWREALCTICALLTFCLMRSGQKTPNLGQLWASDRLPCILLAKKWHRNEQISVMNWSRNGHRRAHSVQTQLHPVIFAHADTPIEVSWKSFVRWMNRAAVAYL